MFYTSTEDCDL